MSDAERLEKRLRTIEHMLGLDEQANLRRRIAEVYDHQTEWIEHADKLSNRIKELESELAAAKEKGDK